jgi:hypothetical protein
MRLWQSKRHDLKIFFLVRHNNTEALNTFNTRKPIPVRHSQFLSCSVIPLPVKIGIRKRVAGYFPPLGYPVKAEICFENPTGSMLVQKNREFPEGQVKWNN